MDNASDYLVNNNIANQYFKKMKRTILFSFLTIIMFNANAQTRFDQALHIASEKHGLVLLNFSGSDWCIPCIKMHDTFFASGAFRELLLDSSLIFVNADFPRSKKNQIPELVQKENDVLADKFNSAGTFPCTILLDANGNVLKRWDGFPKEGAVVFVQEIRSFIPKSTH